MLLGSSKVIEGNSSKTKYLYSYLDSMKKIIRISTIVAVLIAIGVAIVILGGLDPKDSCLDQGGSYDHQTGMCNK